MIHKNLFRYSCAFFSKHNITVRFVRHLRIHPACFRGRHVNFRARILLQKILLMIIRVSVPYSGASEYLTMLLPAALFSFLAALVCALVVSRRFVDSVTQPLSNIAAEMSKVKGDYKGDYTELHFEKCQYPELNVIAETTMEMSKNVKAYLTRIDKEKRIRQEFFSNASHELKTPITSIQGYAELIENGMIQDENMKMDFIKRIKKEAINMAGLINDILMISRLEAKDAETNN